MHSQFFALCHDIVFPLASDLELRTSGRAGEHHGAKMGVYQLHSEDEGQGRIYKQRHDSGGDQFYLHRSVSDTNMYNTLT